MSRPVMAHTSSDNSGAFNNNCKAEAAVEDRKPLARKPVFKKHYSKKLIKDCLQRGELVSGKLRINPRNYEQAYIDNPDEEQADILIYGMKDRNRALQGDVVAVAVKPRKLWKVDEDYIPVPAETANVENSHVEFFLRKVSRCGKTSVDESANLLYNQETNDLPADTLLALSSSDSSILDLYWSEDMNKNSRAETDVVTPSSAAESTDPNINELMKALNVCDKSSIDVQASGSSTVVPKNASFQPFKLLQDIDSDVPDKFLQMTGEVVGILEEKHSRVAAGRLKLHSVRNNRSALFSPKDPKVPRMLIPMEECPKNFLSRANDFKDTLFAARIVVWNEYSNLARGSLEGSLGSAGEIGPETDGMLAEYNIDTSEFEDTTLACLPKLEEGKIWEIPQSEFCRRRDFRNDCVFTIDPSTARDLDDALHLKRLPDGMYEIGVHIADVSYFVETDSELDYVASQRATSVYLVHKVIPMLPRMLCEDLCSLNPGVDRLTFSVVWKMDGEGNAYEEWMGRSVIRSCSKLSYDVAQDFIDHPNKAWSEDELPPISDGYSPQLLCQNVVIFHEIAQNLRKKRFGNGALRLDQAKLSFALSAETGMPVGCQEYVLKESNRLIEEFMLLANMAVARRLYKSYPSISILRNHPPPKAKVLREVLELCALLGYPLDGTDSGSMQASLNEYFRQAEYDPKVATAIPLLVLLCMKPMNLALYFCTGHLKDVEKFRHYALNVPFYTHFTSPIRRYPDIMVHRLLAASLGYSEPPNWNVKRLQNQALHCNEKKQTAKTVGELSSELFFHIFVRETGPIETTGVVLGIMDHSFDVILTRFGLQKRVYCNKLEKLSSFAYSEGPPPRMQLVWQVDDKKQQVQELRLCQAVNITLSKTVDPTRILIVVAPPKSQ